MTVQGASVIDVQREPDQRVVTRTTTTPRSAVDVWSDPEAHPFISRVRSAVLSITSVGWAMVILGLVTAVIGWLLHWRELGFVAAFALCCLVIASVTTMAPGRVGVELEVTPIRVRPGADASAHISISNEGKRSLAGLGVDVPVGVSVEGYRLSALKAGESHDEWISVSTHHRGVVPIGPAAVGRSDPFGLIKRQLSEETDPQELIIHPEIIPVGSFATGLLRDIEGSPSDELSQADLEFHRLRDYVRGDDQRLVSWKATARASESAGEDKLMVRQFLDTRRSHIVVCCDCDLESFASPNQFEMALSCAASLAAQATRDDLDVTVLCDRNVTSRVPYPLCLDIFSRAQLGSATMTSALEKIKDIAPDASLIISVIGPHLPTSELDRSRLSLPSQVKMLVVKITSDSDLVWREAPGLSELTVSSLPDLARAFQRGLV